MTDFDKIKNYYKEFDEKNRLINSTSGRLEQYMTNRILDKFLPSEGDILDLGGGAGVYAFSLAKKGYKVTLADLSEDLINQAIERKVNEHVQNVVSCDVVNAIDLSKYGDGQFDVVLLFGPLYHLLDKEERAKCIKEVNRVIKKGGIVFASFIPYLSGSIAIVDRYFKHPEQVNVDNLKEVFNSGKFSNASSSGFQEGYYPTSEEIEQLFSNYGFEKEVIRSIRGFGYEKEDEIYNIQDEDMFNNIMDFISQTASDSSIIETCGHAMYVGSKR